MRRVHAAYLARAAHYTRQYLLKIRLGKRPSRRCQLTLVAALHELTGEALPLQEIFEPPGASIASLFPQRGRSGKTRFRPQVFTEVVSALSDSALRTWITTILATPAALTHDDTNSSRHCRSASGSFARA